MFRITHLCYVEEKKTKSKPKPRQQTSKLRKHPPSVLSCPQQNIGLMAEDVSSDDDAFDPDEPLATTSKHDKKPLITPPQNPEQVLANFAVKHDLDKNPDQTTSQIFSQGKAEPI